jgi:uncharacterized membrane protein
MGGHAPVPVNRFRLQANLRTSVWFVPVICVLGGVLLSIATIAIDRITNFELVPTFLTGGPDAAATILSTTAAAEVTLTALVLTVTMVVVQLAMGQFSPRIVQTILQDKPSQIAIGLFVATFAHAMIALPQVDFEAGTVPGLAVVVAYILVVASIIVLVIYVDHIGKSLRASALIELVGDETRRTLDERYPAARDGAAPDRDPARLVAPRSGVLSLVDEATLVDLARDADGSVELHVAVGAFVPAGTQLATLHGGAVTLDHDDVLATLVLALDRNLRQDVAYGLRLLVDIAERSLADSPFLDPTTAVQSLDRIHDCMRHLASRPFPSGERRDEAGVVRVVTPVMGWDDYVQLAFVEIRMAGAGSPQVARRLKEVLDDLLACAPQGRRPPLERERSLLAAAVRQQYGEPADVEFASTADRQGVGTGPPRAVHGSRVR